MTSQTVEFAEANRDCSENVAQQKGRSQSWVGKNSLHCGSIFDFDMLFFLFVVVDQKDGPCLLRFDKNATSQVTILGFTIPIESVLIGNLWSVFVKDIIFKKLCQANVKVALPLCGSKGDILSNPCVSLDIHLANAALRNFYHLKVGLIFFGISVFDMYAFSIDLFLRNDQIIASFDFGRFITFREGDNEFFIITFAKVFSLLG